MECGFQLFLVSIPFLQFLFKFLDMSIEVGF